MKHEQWAWVVGYEGLYEVSSVGRVRRLAVVGEIGRLAKEKMLKPTMNSSGYPGVALSKDSIRSWISVHRLVASAFIPNPDNRPFVNHLNSVKSDSAHTNLEWCTARENSHHAARNGRIPSGARHVKSVPIRVVCPNGEAKGYPSFAAAAKDLGLPYPSVVNGGMCHGHLITRVGGKSSQRKLHVVKESSTKLAPMIDELTEKRIAIRFLNEQDRVNITAAANADALPIHLWITSTAIREARKRVAQLKANTKTA